MQSSGATLVALVVAQEPGAVACLDVFCGELSPSVTAFPADWPSAVKATVSTTRAFEEHVDCFRRERTVLVLRDPAHVYASLTRKEYASMRGAPGYRERCTRWQVLAGGWWGDAVRPRAQAWMRRTRRVARQAVRAGR
jgi:hypothetical protein